jgi:hypothetical protein
MANHKLGYELLLDIGERIIHKALVPNVLEHAFSHQVNFIRDKNKQKALFCTRRSAKSYTAGLYLVHEALSNPGCNCLFIGLTRASAKGIIWKDILSKIDLQYNLGCSFNQTELTMTLPNGSVISVTGVDVDEKEMNKLLGRKYRLVCIDEASMYTIDLRNLVYGVLGPAMVDPNDDGESGTICLMGTASDFPRGLFYDITTNAEKSWKLFKWTAFDNPHVARLWREALEKIKNERPTYMETPQFKQWYLNQWVVDEEKLVYRFDMHRNLCTDIPRLPHDGWTYVLGVDTGWEDDTALVLTAYHANNPFLYVPRVFKKKKMTFDDVVVKIEEFMKDPIMSPHKVVIDGANKQGVESMRQRSSIPFEYADKQDKATFIELCNSDLIQGKIKILDKLENRDLWLEMSSLVWKTDGDKIKYPKQEHPALPNHLCFIAGTMIQTPTGQVPIETLRCGDLVETRKGPRRIQNTMNSKARVISLHMSDGTSITCTPDHPFWSDGTWIEALYLTSTDILLSWAELQSQRELCSGASTACVAQDSSKRIESVYNITVEEEHEYFANGLLVSNCDAFLYSWRCGWHYAATPADKKITIGSREWYLQQSEEIWEKERDNLTRQDDWMEMGSLGDLE